jgi:hypothetical protein
VLGGIDGDHREQRRGLLLDRDALAACLLRQAGEGDLDAVVDVDGVDIRVGAELERGGERVAAVVAAHTLHVDKLVDADHLRFDRLGDRAVDDGGRGAGKGGGDRYLRRHDVRVLRDRDRVQR